MRSQIVGKAGVPVGMIAKVLFVDPHIEVHVDAVETNLEIPVRRKVRNREPLPVPSGPAKDVSSSHLTWAKFPIERSNPHGSVCGCPQCITPSGMLACREILDAPIVGQVEATP